MQHAANQRFNFELDNIQRQPQKSRARVLLANDSKRRSAMRSSVSASYQRLQQSTAQTFTFTVFHVEHIDKLIQFALKLSSKTHQATTMSQPKTTYPEADLHGRPASQWTAAEKNVIKKSYMAGLTNKEIAKRCNTTLSAIKNYIHRQKLPAKRKKEIELLDMGVSVEIKKKEKAVEDFLKKYVKKGDHLYDVAAQLAKDKANASDAREFVACVNAMDKLMRGVRLNLGLDDGVRANQYSVTVQGNVQFGGQLGTVSGTDLETGSQIIDIDNETDVDN